MLRLAACELPRHEVSGSESIELFVILIVILAALLVILRLTR